MWLILANMITAVTLAQRDRALDDRGRDVERLLDQLLQLVARHRTEFEIALLHLGLERGIGKHRRHRAAQHREPVGGNVRRRHQRAADLGGAAEQRQHLLVLVGLAELDHRRHVLEQRMPRLRILHQHVDLLLLQPVRLAEQEVFERRVRAFGLAALHRQHGAGGAGIALDHLEARAGELVHHARHDVGGGAGAGRGHHGLALHGVRDGLGRRGVPGQRDLDDRREAAEPAELAHVVVDRRRRAAPGSTRAAGRSCRWSARPWAPGWTR